MNSRAISFDAMPDEARIWIIPAAEAVPAETSARLLQQVDAFLEEWHAHGHPVVGARDWRYDQFLLVAVDEASAGASGCSIDAMVNTLARLERALSVQDRDAQ